MYQIISLKRRRRSKRDYTKDPALRWFVVLLIALASYIIIQTLTSNGRTADETILPTQHQQNDKEKKPQEENFDPRSWN